MAEDTDVETGLRQILQEAGLKTGEVVPQTMEQMLRNIDANEIREDVFLSAVVNELSVKADRLRHRAMLMRQRADEFDEYADDIENNRIESVKEYVFTLMQHIHQIEAVLQRHAHVEPTKVKS